MECMLWFKNGYYITQVVNWNSIALDAKRLTQASKFCAWSDKYDQSQTHRTRRDNAPMFIKLDLMENYVKTLKKTSHTFLCLGTKFPKLS